MPPWRSPEARFLREVGDGATYLFATSPLTLDEAKQMCTDEGGIMAIPVADWENEFIAGEWDWGAWDLTGERE